MNIKIIVMANVKELPKQETFSFPLKRFPGGLPKQGDFIRHPKLYGEVTSVLHMLQANGTTFIPHIYVYNRSFSQTYKTDTPEKAKESRRTSKLHNKLNGIMGKMLDDLKDK